MLGARDGVHGRSEGRGYKNTNALLDGATTFVCNSMLWCAHGLERAQQVAMVWDGLYVYQLDVQWYGMVWYAHELELAQQVRVDVMAHVCKWRPARCMAAGTGSIQLTYTARRRQR